MNQEEIYINEYQNPHELWIGIKEYVKTYNYERPHDSLDNERPVTVYDAKFGSQESRRAA